MEYLALRWQRASCLHVFLVLTLTELSSELPHSSLYAISRHLTVVVSNARLFCVGNPSNVDLEAQRRGKISFSPPTWHASVGACVGYLNPEAQRAQYEQAGRGRAPTRGHLACTR